MLASELSELTGQTLTAAVISALESRLDEEKRKRRKPNTAEQILAFADRFAAGIPRGSSSADHAWLYGDDGMPH